MKNISCWQERQDLAVWEDLTTRGGRKERRINQKEQDSGARGERRGMGKVWDSGRVRKGGQEQVTGRAKAWKTERSGSSQKGKT
jgi:hypothetical protein